MSVFLYFLGVLPLLVGPGEGYYFEDGYRHHYTYVSNSQVFSKENLRMQIQFHVECFNRSGDGSSLNSLYIDSFIQFAGNRQKSNPDKWDYGKRFLFHMDDDGLIESVHYDETDKEEAVMIKKVLASTLSAKSKQTLSSPEKFVSLETDHTGHLVHQYEVRRSKQGLHVNKFHESIDKVYRMQQKQLLLSHGGTIQTVTGKDMVELRDQSKPEPERPPISGETNLNLTAETPMPPVGATTTLNVKLDSKRKSPIQRVPVSTDSQGLRFDSIVAKVPKSLLPKKANRKQDLRIDDLLQCIESYENKTNPNRTQCVSELSQEMKEMNDTQYLKLIKRELNKSCDVGDSQCEDRKNLFIDLVADKGDELSQTFLAEDYLSNNDANTTEVERILVHLVRLEHPTMLLIEAVESLCFQIQLKHLGVSVLTQLQRKACLTIGALAHNDDFPEKKENLVARLESWLQEHDPVESYRIIKPKKKRSVHEFDQRRHFYIHTKLVLIHALGNAGMNRSVGIITSYMHPHNGHNDWKRAAIHGLRFYTCNESADALVRSFAEDDNDLVRELAYEMYKQHALSGDGHNQRHKDIIRSTKYTYHHLMRLKRSLITAEFKDGGIYFSIRLPGIEWSKKVGGSAMGAGFGLTIRNGMEVDVKPLQGYAEVDVYNEAYINVYLGWFNLKFDIVRAKYCYQGHIRYDLNILKDFGINDIQDLAKIFDKIYKAVVSPIENAIAAFRAIVDLFKGGINKIINDIVDFIKNLPLVLKTLVEDLVDGVYKALKYKAYPWIAQIQKIVFKVRYFIEDIKADVMEFYNTIADAITVTLPYGAKKIYDAVAGINNGFKNFFKNPVQAIFGVGRAILDIRFAIGIFFDVKNKIMETITMATGKSPFWMNYDEDLSEILEDISDLIDTVTNPSSVSVGGQQTSAEMTSLLSDGIKSVSEQTSVIKDALNKVFNTFTSLITSTLDKIGKPFFDATRSVMEAVRGVKMTFENLRNVFIKSKSLVEKVFGPKFHVSFPSRRRDEVSGCGSGVWPTTTNDKYSTMGVDVLAGSGEKIACPVNGIVRKIGDNRVSIQPDGDDFSDLEIIIDNVDPEVSEGGEYLRAGEDDIGRATTSPCQPNFIHVAVRQTSEDSGVVEDEDFDYVDPSKYLDRLMPYPKWVETCNENYYKEFSFVIDSDILAAALQGLDNVVERIKDKAEQKFQELKNKIEDNVQEMVITSGSGQDIEPQPLSQLNGEPEVYRPPGMDLVDHNDPKNHQAWDDFKNGLKGVLKEFKNVAKQLFDFSANRIGTNILDIIDISRYTIAQIRDIVDKKLTAEIDVIFEKLAEIQKAIPRDHMEGLSLVKMRQMLRFAMDKIGGTKSQMISRILEISEKECPKFAGHLTKGEGHVCFAHPDCQGLSCSLSVEYGALHETVEFDVRMDPCSNSLNVSSQNAPVVQLEFLAGEFTHTVRFSNLPLDNVVLDVIVEGYTDIDNPVFSVQARLCSEGFESCLPEMEVITDLEVAAEGNCNGADDKYTISSLEQMTLRELVEILADYHLLTKDVLDAVDTLREAVLKELLDDPRTILNVLGVEFKNKIDFCKDAAKPMKPRDYPLFYFEFTILVGPVPVTFYFGASAAAGLDMRFSVCFLSFKGEVFVTPWGGAQAYGGAEVRIFIFRAGLKLTGYLLDTRFPIYGGVQFNKFPIDTVATMDLYMVPLRLVLTAYAEIYFRICFWKCWTVRITLFRGNIWQYSTPAIRKRILTFGSEGQDLSPPTFDDNGKRISSSGRKRSVSSGCELYQLPGRNPTDTAFKLRATVSDDITEAKLFFAIGTSQGGTNVMDWTDMGGALLVYAVDLPNSIPLYWTLKARNNQGLESFTNCMLHTYDNTVPDGRADASYKYSSHPDTLSSTVITFDDSPLQNTHLVALGYSPGMYGNEVVGWQTFSLSDISVRTDINTDLKHFAEPKTGKLTTAPYATHVEERPSDCATECLKHPTKCVSFDYNYFTERCDLQMFVEGPAAKLRTDGYYKNYERLGIGQNAFIQFTNLPLRHGTEYYFNAIINNTLNYTGVMHSSGTMVDFTPPEPGYLGTYYTERYQADGCSASLNQENRCINVTPLKNHRIVQDGNESRTVFNGHRPLDDLRYTRSNHYASVNFDGFRDNETGIYSYMWAVGTDVCKNDTVGFQDPHEFLHSSKHWTHSGYQKNITLRDGWYYVTVQALNNIVFGGALVTTVCHITPVAVDTTPPDFNGVTEIFYDEDFDMLAVYYSAEDPLSDLYSIDFGLGKTKYDVLVRRYSYHKPMERTDPYIVVEDLGLQDGVPAWIRIRPMNNVRLFTAGHGDEPVLLDRSPPIAGVVLDGDIVLHDFTYQADNKRICAHWNSFYDPESGIEQFRWGVGLTPGEDDIVRFHNYSHNQRHACVSANLVHNTTYYSTVIVFNGGLNTKDNQSTSNGVLVDTTPPEAGDVHDGSVFGQDIAFSSATATKTCYWDNFTDPESGIEKYQVSLIINNELKRTFDVGLQEEFVDHSVTLYHEDEVTFTVTATNGAGSTTDVTSDGFKVDHTPPVMNMISDSDTGLRFQTSTDTLNLKWQYEDRESGIKEYRYFIFENKHGSKSRFWPTSDPYTVLRPSVQGRTERITLDNLALSTGGRYSLHVTAINRADMSTAHESEGVIIDDTPPVVTLVHIGLLEEDEEINSQGQVEHPDPDGITVTWEGFDRESGVDSFYLAIGTSPGDASVTGSYQNMGDQRTSYVKVTLETYSDSGKVYYVSVKAKNGAGVFSAVLHSSPIIVLRANVPGVIFDGREKFVDTQKSRDTSSIAMSFSGFESESCNIISYELSVGSEPYFSNISPFSEFAVIHNETHGYGELNIDLEDDRTYYATVRAKTGHNCHEEFIVSTSNGITIDSNRPRISDISPLNEDGHYHLEKDVYYQNNVDSLDMSWNVSDISSDVNVNFSIGRLPFAEDIYPSTENKDGRIPPSFVQLNEGESTFVTVTAVDDVGNIYAVTSRQVIADISKPMAVNFTCSHVISGIQPKVTCTWTTQENQSSLRFLTVAITSTGVSADIKPETNISTSQSSWSSDLHDVLSSMTLTSITVRLKLTNVLGLEEVFVSEVRVDHTPPDVTSVDIVTWTAPSEPVPVQVKMCQIPWTYVDARIVGAQDPESDISRFEVCLGTAPNLCNLRSYKEVKDVASIFIGDLSLTTGRTVHATAIVYNTVGLSTVITSKGVVVSPDPLLTVVDGAGPTDSDFQSDLNIIQGNWEFSDPCPITHAEWAIHDLSGNTIQDFTKTAGNGNVLYNDELSLDNNLLYTITVRITDAINRTFEARSDGIVILIQPPSPGDVRDGLEGDDIDYQQSTTELSANWDSFGTSGSSSPTQMIDHYEVAIGNDRREHITRVNVHYFVNVGLNTSHTFTHLNLTAKTVTYYVTVRAYSLTGVYEEEYTNGIRVGYKEGVTPGEIEYTPYQSNTGSVRVSWDAFEADVGIQEYIIGLSTTPVITHNDTFPCSQIEEANITKLFDIVNPIRVKLNTIHAFFNLTLQHGQSYYVTVFAEDVTLLCAAATGGPILVDTTPPGVSLSSIVLNNWIVNNKEFVYVNNDLEIAVEVDNVQEVESGIQKSVFKLVRYKACPSGNISSGDFELLQELEAANKTGITFFDAAINSSMYFKILILIVNNAGLSSTMESPLFSLDKTSPLKGVVKIATDWYSPIEFQASTSAIQAFTAVARTYDSYICLNSKKMYPSETERWTALTDTYTPSNVKNFQTKVVLDIGYNIPLTKVLKSGLRSDLRSLDEGSYTVNLTSASGKNIVTTFSMATNLNYFPVDFSPPAPKTYDDNDLANAADEAIVETSTTANNYTSFTETTSATTTVHVTVAGTDREQMKNPEDIGFGFHILGTRQNGSLDWDILLWAADKYRAEEEWFTISFDPSDNTNTYALELTKQEGIVSTTWNLNLKINGVSKAAIDGMQFIEDMFLYIQTWNKDGYEEPITDPFKPFRSKAEITEVTVPLGYDKPCLHGKGSYDGESGISEIRVGVSDNVNSVDNVKEMYLYKSLCVPCTGKCPIGCDPNCKNTGSSSDFEVLDLKIDNLDLTATTTSSDGSNATILNEIRNSSTYYVNVEFVNFAGQSSLARSNPIMVDNTPPNCQILECTDPANTGLDEPTKYLGSNKTIGAYWSCEENLSEIKSYAISVGINSADDSLYAETAVGLKTKLRIDLRDPDTFEHGKTYYVNLRVTNSAGLSSNFSCSTFASLYPPDVSHTNRDTMFIDSSRTQLQDAYVTQEQNKIGTSWDSPYDDAEFYEFQLGTEDGGSDLVPRITVGVSKSGSVAVIGGELWLDGFNTNKSISEFTTRNLRNYSIEDNRTSEIDYKLYSEPGRCLYPKLYAVSYSHLSAEIPTEPVCIARADDVVEKFDGRKTYNITLPSTLNSGAVSLNITGGSGGIITGMLSDEDTQSSYGSSSSEDFISYVVDPNSTLTVTNRYLRRRLVRSIGISFFLSPAPSASIEKVTISIRVDASQFNNETVPALLVWNTHDTESNPYGSTGMWNHVTESCSGDPTNPRIENGLYIVEICPEVFLKITKTRSKRSTMVTTTTPVQFSVIAMNTTYYNNPPVIDTASINLDEDTQTQYQLQWHDADFDGVVFSLPGQPVNGTANITEDGILYYQPDPDFAGTDFVEVIITENSTISPASVPYTIMLVVADVNDAPLSAYVYNDTTYETLTNNTVVILFEANTTHRYVLDFYLADIDANETLTILTSASNTHNVSFHLTEDSSEALRSYLFQSEPIRTHRKFAVDMVVDRDFSGDFSYYLLGYDKSNYYTERLEAHVYMLIHPCRYGECAPKYNDSEPCDHIVRATTFDPYICTCYPGYEGEWCETETDECALDPCGIMSYCVDRVNSFQCRPHPGKWVAVVLSFLAFVFVLYLIFIHVKKKYGEDPKVYVQEDAADDRKFEIDPDYDYGDVELDHSVPDLVPGRFGTYIPGIASDNPAFVPPRSTALDGRECSKSPHIPHADLMRQEFIENRRPIFHQDSLHPTHHLDRDWLPAKDQQEPDDGDDFKRMFDSLEKKQHAIPEQEEMDIWNDGMNPKEEEFDDFIKSRVDGDNFLHQRTDMFDSDYDDNDEDVDVALDEVPPDDMHIIPFQGPTTALTPPKQTPNGKKKGKGKKHKRFETSLPPLRSTLGMVNPAFSMNRRRSEAGSHPRTPTAINLHNLGSGHEEVTASGRMYVPEPDYDVKGEDIVKVRPESAGSMSRMQTRDSRVSTPLGGNTIDLDGTVTHIDV